MPEQMVEMQRQANLAGQNPALDDLAVKHIQKTHDRLKRLRGPFETEWADCSRAYDLLKVRQYYHGRSDLTLPTVANLVERLVPRIVRATVGRDDFFEVIPERPEDKDKADINRELVKSQMARADFRRKYPALVRDTCIYGTGIWKARWRYEVRPDTGQTLFDGPDGDPLDIMNVWVDPRAQDFSTTPVVELMSLSYTEVKRLERQGIFQNVETALERGGTGGNYSEDVQRIRRDRAHGFTEMGMEPGHYKYVEYWGEFPLDAQDALSAEKTETVPCVIGILADKYVVRLERNPFECQQNPYFKTVLLERVGEFYGVSLVKKVLNLWIEQNDARNQANDARSFAVCPVVITPPTGKPDKTPSLRIFPGARLTLPQGSQFGSFPDVTTPVQRWEPVLRRDMEETVGAPSLLDAQGDAGSATEASIQQAESGVRIAGYAHAIEDVFIVPLLAFHHELNRQFLTVETAVRTKGFKGFDFRTIKPEDVAGQFTFMTVGASSMSRGPALTAQFLGAMDRMVAIEQMAPGSFDLLRFWETFLKDALDIPHPEMYIKGLKFRGRVPTVDEVHMMLLQGKSVEPDPRQNFADTLPQYGAYIAEVKDALPEDILKLFLDHLLDAEATAREVLQAKLAQMAMQRAEMIASAPAPGSNGGRSNQERDDSDRDGRGFSTARQSMKSSSQGTAGRQ